MAAPPGVFVQLVIDGVKTGALTHVAGVDCSGRVGVCLSHIFDVLRATLKEYDPSQTLLFLSDEAGIEATPPDYAVAALKPNKTLQDEVLDRLNPTGAGAGVPIPTALYLVAVVTGACGGGVVVWVGFTGAHPPPFLPLGARTAGAGTGTGACRVEAGWGYCVAVGALTLPSRRSSGWCGCHYAESCP